MSACVVFAACGSKEKETTADEPVTAEIIPIEEPVTTAEEESSEEEEALPEGMIYSELTGLPIDKSLEKQKPIAALVDNESKALPHYGLNSADIIYEMVNSTANDRITRLMVIYKDWGNIEQLGSIRSIRPTHIWIAGEYNAVMCHDGGPFYIDTYLSHDYAQHFSGIFSRVNNGKAREFTEYITQTDLQKYLKNSTTISSEYTKYYTGPHFQFTEECALDGNDYLYTKDATKKIVLPFPHNSSELHYNADTNLYEYYEYGNAHKDGATGEVLSVRNVILQKASFGEWGLGYMWYNITGDGEGYYITDGKCVPITWHKD